LEVVYILKGTIEKKKIIIVLETECNIDFKFFFGLKRHSF